MIVSVSFCVGMENTFGRYSNKSPPVTQISNHGRVLNVTGGCFILQSTRAQAISCPLRVLNVTPALFFGGGGGLRAYDVRVFVVVSDSH